MNIPSRGIRRLASLYVFVQKGSNRAGVSCRLIKFLVAGIVAWQKIKIGARSTLAVA